MITVDNLKPPTGSKRARRRVGRGIAGKGGKTAGRGTKGQKARGQIKPGFEGGQLPLTQRVPKLKGFKNPFKVEYAIINLNQLQQMDVNEVTPELLAKAGLVAKRLPIKVLGNGELTKPMVVHAHAFSASAKEAICRVGGGVNQVPLPWKYRKPLAGNNALANR
jgi:large subunit ribosomal protein L15